MYKAKIFVDIDNEVQPTLCDTGCEKTCISERFLRRHPKLYDNPVRPFEGSTISIDGSRVETIGIMNIPFRINGRHLRMPVRIVRNLVYNFILGWDFFSKYKCAIHPSEGYLAVENDRVDLVPNSLDITSSHFSLAEDAVIPPLSKMITQASFFLNPADNITPSDTVEVQPLTGNMAKVAVGRAISKVSNGRFPVELLNPYDTPITVNSDEILGHVCFTNDEEVNLNTEATDIILSYGSEDEGYETEEGCSAHTTAAEAPPPASKPPKEDVPPDLKIDYSSIAEDAKPHLENLKELLEVKHRNTFSTSDRDRGKTDLVSYQAYAKPGPPICVPPYRATPQMQAEMDKQVHEMIADGLVSHSTSAYSAPVLMVPKKTPGQWRLVTDFRKLNARCERVVYPLPRIEDSLRKLNNPKFFSTMDLTKGFWQVPIAEKDRKLFAFSTGTLHVEYNVMPMGALNSSATMQALMALILRGLPAEHILCFLDDILVASSTMEEHLLHLDLVLSAVSRAGLKLNANKCLFAQDSVSCLGHRLSRDGISPDPHNLEKIKKWKPPQNRTEIRQFLGLTGYYRQMVEGYAKIAAPLTNLTKLDVEWKWSDVEQKAFETLRDYLTSDVIMAYPDFSKPFWVKSDASGNSVGFVLTQKHDNREKVIAYGSKKLTETQQRYCTYDREFFGILTAIRSYQHYLRQGHFFVVTDHRPLLNLRKLDPKSDATGRRVRWSIELNLYDFTVVYKKGRAHGDADAMSRLTDHDDYAEDEDCAGFLGDEGLFALVGSEEGTHAVVELISDNTKRKALEEAQDEDLTIFEVKEAIRQGAPLPTHIKERFYTSNFKRLVIKDGILSRKAVCGVSEIPILQSIIPPKVVDSVLREAHGGKFAGHPGYKRLSTQLLRHSIWPDMFRDTREFVRKCPQCDIVSQPNPPARTELQSMNPEFVFEHVCCDLIQLPTAPGGWKYICVFMDVFSRHVTFYKFRDKSMTSFTRALEDYVAHVGCPHKLTCDNGAEFCNELVEATTRVMGIKKRTSVVYRPQSQGMVERMNREIIDQLTKRLRQCDTAWPEHMHFVALAHNASTSSRTGESPNMVFYGRELPIPSFTDVSVNTLRSKSSKEYVEKMKERVQKVHEAIRRESKRQSEITAESYNKSVKHTPHKAGDLVYYKEIPKNREKTDPKWSGPVEVVSRHLNRTGQPGTTYTLRYKDGETISRNYEQLKRAWAEFKDPISKSDLRLAPAPLISHRVYFTDEEDAQAPPPGASPVALRTRSRRLQAEEPPRAPELPPPSGSTQGPAAPMAAGFDTTSLPASSSSDNDSHSEEGLETTLISGGDSSRQNENPSSSNITSPDPSWDSVADGMEADGANLNRNVSPDYASLGICNLTLPPPPANVQPPLVESEPTSSQATTPDPTQNTMIQVSPSRMAAQASSIAVDEAHVSPLGPPPASPAVSDSLSGIGYLSNSPSDVADASESPADVVMPEANSRLPTSPLPHKARRPLNQLSAIAEEEEESPHNTSSLENFFDVLEEDMEFRQVGNKQKTDVLVYQGYEFSRERLGDRNKPTQYWRCRHKTRFKCKGRLTLRVSDVNNITHNARVDNFTPHSHQPRRMKSYGTADVSVLRTTDSNLDDITYDDTEASGHGASQLSEGDYERESEQEDFMCSSFAGNRSRAPPFVSDAAAASIVASAGSSDMTELDWESSQLDARGYNFHKYITCKRRDKERFIDQRRDEGDSSDQ